MYAGQDTAWKDEGEETESRKIAVIHTYGCGCCSRELLATKQAIREAIDYHFKAIERLEALVPEDPSLLADYHAYGIEGVKEGSSF